MTARSGRKETIMNDKKETIIPEEKKTLDLDELDQVSGGANPFAQYERVPEQPIDDKIKDKV